MDHLAVFMEAKMRGANADFLMPPRNRPVSTFH
jgi:hypothetical protein